MTPFKIPIKQNIEALRLVAGVMPSHSNLPILGCVLMRGGGTSVVTTDLDVTVIATLEDIGGNELPDICIDGATLLRISDRGHDLTVDGLDEKQKTITVTTDDGARYVLPVQSESDFPATPKLRDGAAFQTATEPLLAALRHVTPAIGQDESRYVLTGALFEHEHNQLTVVATDGRRLHASEMVSTPNTPKPPPHKFILPHGAVRHLSALLHLQKFNVPVRFEVDAKADSVRIECGRLVIISRLIDGEYPNWRKVVPDVTTANLVVPINVSSWIAALESLLPVLSDCQNDSVEVKFQPLKVEFTAGSSDTGHASTSIPCASEDGNLSAILSSQYLLDALRPHAGESAVIRLQSSLAPFTITAPPTTSVIMPKRHNG